MAQRVSAVAARMMQRTREASRLERFVMIEARRQEALGEKKAESRVEVLARARADYAAWRKGGAGKKGEGEGEPAAAPTAQGHYVKVLARRSTRGVGDLDDGRDEGPSAPAPPLIAPIA